MPKLNKPAPLPKKVSQTQRMVEECVKRAQARKRSGQTDREWQKQYAASLKVDNQTAPLSTTPFDGSASKKKV